MLINLDKWRSEDALGMFLETNERLASKHVWVDQDLINATLFGRWLPLGPTYNFQTNGFASYRRAYSRQYREVYPSGCRTFAARDVDEASRCPHIIHYTIQRPWQPANRHPLRRTYWSYRNRIPIRKSAAEIPIIYYAKRLLRWPVRAIQRCVLGAVRPILRTVTGRVKKG
jgi:lipopolysaccharide biosynthesis glycosyltransferase